MANDTAIALASYTQAVNTIKAELETKSSEWKNQLIAFMAYNDE